jgi:hypothetical protein
MREIKKLNPEESISKRRLVFDESWLDKFNRLTVYLVFSPLIFLPVIMFFNEKNTNPNDTFILHYVFPISILIGLYIFYRNATEKLLSKINTDLARQEARRLLLEYAEKEGFEIYRKSSDCLIFNETYSDFSSDYKKTRIFFIQDNIVLFVVIRDSFKLNIPTLFTHLFLKRDIIRLLKKVIT